MATHSDPHSVFKQSRDPCLRKCIPWTPDEEEILFNLKSSYPKAPWSSIKTMHNQLVIPSPQRSVDGLCAKWKTLKNKDQETSYTENANIREVTNLPADAQRQLSQDTSTV